MALAALAFAACVEDKPYKGSTDPSIVSVNHAPTTPGPGEAVSVTAVTANITALDLKYTVDGGEVETVTMTKSGDTFTGTITGQADGAVVDYYVKAGSLESTHKGYTVTATGPGGPDYADLVLNEINGTGADADKYYELYNKGEVTLSLENVQIWYGTDTGAGDFGVSWMGVDGDEIEAGEYYVIQGAKSGVTNPSFDTGLSGKKNVIVALFEPDVLGGEVETTETFTVQDALALSLDYIQRGPGDDENAADGIESAFGRVPDATGEWYFVEGSKGATNGTSTVGLTLVNAD